MILKRLFENNHSPPSFVNSCLSQNETNKGFVILKPMIFTCWTVNSATRDEENTMSDHMHAFFTTHCSQEQAFSTADDLARLPPFVKDALLKNIIIWVHEYEKTNLKKNNANALEFAVEFKASLAAALRMAMQERKSSAPRIEQLFTGLESQITRELFTKNLLEEAKLEKDATNPPMELLIRAAQKTAHMLKEEVKKQNAKEGLWIAKDIKTLTEMLVSFSKEDDDTRIKKEEKEKQYAHWTPQQKKVRSYLETKIEPIVASFNLNFSYLNLSMEESVIMILYKLCSILRELSKENKDVKEVFYSIERINIKFSKVILGTLNDSDVKKYLEDKVKIRSEFLTATFSTLSLNHHEQALTIFVAINTMCPELAPKYKILDDLLQISTENAGELAVVLCETT